MEELVGTALALVVIQTGRLLIWLISGGRWRGETLPGKEGTIYSAAGALSFVRDGRRVITENGLLIAGIAFYVALVLGTIAWAMRATGAG
ncbi:MAG: hypothetical protein Q7U63_09935 [Polaromonas sp.]|uniref:hypothetical protein n=1 Tax=Polaromonas sp. TaxID=1869339 RepID=UPI00271F923E|nr:hypothetical protein [Polaromonas sp.]MDO9114103.1 hypothetical protein [Polaromonas sp.]MDP1885837.1 hypothetical protein [Polaromonas sp.]